MSLLQTDKHKVLFQQLLSSQTPNLDMSRVATIILAGGQGSRLYPLTRTNCKPAITFGGKYRLIDIPMSNAINSGCHKIFVVTQFLSKTLHDHIFNTYRPGLFSKGFVEILTVEEKPLSKNWFQGTADAIRQNLDYLVDLPVEYFLILSGDQIYHMDYQKMMHTALQTNAEVVIATLPVEKNEAKRFGIMQINANKYITNFIEKPQDPSLLDQYKIDESNTYLGSMGIYLFKRKALLQLLRTEIREDFGKHLIPSMVEKGTAAAHLHDGYWEDIGTIESYYHANLALTQAHSNFNWYDEKYPITAQSFSLPAPKFNNTLVQNSIICEGSVVEAQQISNSILGPRSIVKQGTIINKSYLIGNDYYEHHHMETCKKDPLLVGENCRIEKCIIDKHVSIGNNVMLINKNKLSHYNSDEVFIRDGIIIVARGASIPDGFVL